jgi:hypothetical protein
MGEDAQSTSAVALKVRKPEGIDDVPDYSKESPKAIMHIGTTVKSPDPYLSPGQICQL